MKVRLIMLGLAVVLLAGLAFLVCNRNPVAPPMIASSQVVLSSGQTYSFPPEQIVFNVIASHDDSLDLGIRIDGGNMLLCKSMEPGAFLQFIAQFDHTYGKLPVDSHINVMSVSEDIVDLGIRIDGGSLPVLLVQATKHEAETFLSQKMAQRTMQ